jgi:hypothetical protein
MTDREKLETAWDAALVALDAARDAYAARDAARDAYALAATSDAKTLYDALAADARDAAAAIRATYAIYNAILAAQPKEKNDAGS